jgi:hypothetical protein
MAGSQVNTLVASSMINSTATTNTGSDLNSASSSRHRRSRPTALAQRQRAAEASASSSAGSAKAPSRASEAPRRSASSGTTATWESSDGQKVTAQGAAQPVQVLAGQGPVHAQLVPQGLHARRRRAGAEDHLPGPRAAGGWRGTPAG